MCRRLVCSLFVLYGLVLAVGPVCAQDLGLTGVKWRYDYQQARREALDRKAPILIDFVKNACPYCVVMDNTVFRDPQVVNLINERFVPLKVQLETNQGLVEFLKIEAFPTFVLAAYDGKVLPPPIIGAKGIPEFYDFLQRALVGQSEPEWMLRDQQLAQKWIEKQEYARAISALKNIIEDGRNRPVQQTARKMLQDLEAIGQGRLAKAKETFERGQSVEAIESVNDTMRIFAGLQVARDGSSLLTRFMQSPDQNKQQRTKRAQELLTQASEFYKFKDYLPCLDRCEVLLTSYGDLPEAQEAYQMSSNIKNDPEWLQNACDVMAERLGNLWLTLADTLLKKGQPDRAKFHLERVIRAFPGTRYAESAQIRLGQLAGVPARRVEIDAASNRP